MSRFAELMHALRYRLRNMAPELHLSTHPSSTTSRSPNVSEGIPSTWPQQDKRLGAGYGPYASSSTFLDPNPAHRHDSFDTRISSSMTLVASRTAAPILRRFWRRASRHQFSCAVADLDTEDRYRSRASTSMCVMVSITKHFAPWRRRVQLRRRRVSARRRVMTSRPSATTCRRYNADASQDTVTATDGAR